MQPLRPNTSTRFFGRTTPLHPNFTQPNVTVPADKAKQHLVLTAEEPAKDLIEKPKGKHNPANNPIKYATRRIIILLHKDLTLTLTLSVFGGTFHIEALFHTLTSLLFLKNVVNFSMYSNIARAFDCTQQPESTEDSILLGHSNVDSMFHSLIGLLPNPDCPCRRVGKT